MSQKSQVMSERIVDLINYATLTSKEEKLALMQNYDVSSDTKKQNFKEIGGYSQYKLKALYNIEDKQDYLKAIDKEKKIIEKINKLYNEVTVPDIEEVYNEYAAACKKNETLQGFSLPSQNKKYALSGTTNFTPVDTKKMHKQTFDILLPWIEGVTKKLEADLPNLTGQDKIAATKLYNHFKTTNYNIQYNENSPSLFNRTINLLQNNFEDMTKNSQYLRGLKMPLVRQGTAFTFVQNNVRASRPTELRIYLNIGQNERLELLNNLREDCKKDKLNFASKFLMDTFSNKPGVQTLQKDNIIIYTDFEDYDKIVKKLENLYSTRPDLFKNAGYPPKLTARLKNAPYIGIAEEPLTMLNGRKESFSSLRQEIFDEYYKKYGTNFDNNKFNEICAQYNVSTDNFAFSTNVEFACKNEQCVKNEKDRLNNLEKRIERNFENQM